MFEKEAFPQLFPGQQIDQYILEDNIGSGGMGIVFSATQVSMDRRVAIKFLPDVSNNPDAVARFEREVRMISQLEHPHILPVYAYGEAFGAPYIVMRYMPGGTVIDLINEGNVSLELALNIVKQTASALDYAHDQAIVHRDIKPSNIFLDERKYAYLADFGLAKTMSGEYDITRTDDGISGTPDYMSPEQVRGLKLDGRADIYSLGIIGFQLLTGHLPYIGKHPMETVMMQINAPIPSIHQLMPHFPPEIDEVFNKVLAKAVSERYETANAFADELIEVLEDNDKSFNLSEASQDVAQSSSKETIANFVQPTRPGKGTGAAIADVSPKLPHSAAPKPVESRRSPLYWILGVASLLTFAFLLFLGWLIFNNPLRNIPSEPFGTLRAPFDIAYDGAGNIWVADNQENRIQRLVANCAESNEPCGEVLATVSVDPFPDRVVTGPGEVLVRHQLSSSISVISSGDNTPASLAIKEIPINFVPVGENIWILTAGAELLEVQRDSHIRFREFAGDLPRSMLLLDDTLWIADEGAGVIRAFELTSKRFNPDRAVVLTSPQFVSLGADPETKRLFAALRETDEVLVIDAVTGSLEVPNIQTDERPIGVWSIKNQLWVLTQQENNVQVFNIDSGRSLGTMTLPARPETGEMIVCGTSCAELWIGFESNAINTLLRYDLSDQIEPLNRFAFLP